jgi:hypothetical protein
MEILGFDSSLEQCTRVLKKSTLGASEVWSELEGSSFGASHRLWSGDARLKGMHLSV